MTWIGVLTWIIIGIPSASWQAQYRSLAGPRAALLFTAFIFFIVAFLLGTRPGCGTPTKFR